jgi:hypothetical protein
MLTKDCLDIINRFLGEYNIKNTKNLKILYNLFEDNYDDNIVKYNIINKNVNDEIKINNPFISNNIINDIKKLKKYTYVNFKLYNNNIKLYIYHNEENLDSFINKILIYIKFMYKISNYKNDLIIKYYLTNSKKKVKKDKNRNHIFTTDEINTGSSSIKEINIWRKEEVLKTTIHELIHYMNLDYRNDTDDIIKYYKINYKCSSDIMNTFESYTDFWAIIINIYLCSKLLNNPFKFFKSMLEIEIAFTIYQCQKILYLSRNKKETLVDFNKYTNIISYYFIKYSLYESIGKSNKCIINYILKNNINLFTIKDLNNYFNYLKKLKIINNNNRRFNKSIIESMRMSVCDIELFNT